MHNGTVAIIVPTVNNWDFLVRMVESLKDYIEGVDWRLIIVDNGSTDQTQDYLRQLRQQGIPLTVITNSTNLGFVEATNQGLAEVKEGEYILLANDDIQFVDPQTLARLKSDLEDARVGMVVPTSDYVMGLQKSEFSFQIPRTVHETNFVVYFCGMWRYETYKEIGGLDPRFGKGGNDDMDLSLRIREAGYKLLIDRRVFVRHYGSRTLLRTGDVAGYDKLNQDTRAILIDKWGEAKVNGLFRIPDFLLYGPEYYRSFGNGGYSRSAIWLAEWKRIACEIVSRVRPKSVLDVGCAHGMLVEALYDLGVPEVFGIDVSDYAISQCRQDMKAVLKVGSAVDGPLLNVDLMTCIEVLEHLSEADGKKAIANMCDHAERILFSSTSTDTTEPTHQNVQKPEYWVKLFTQNDFAVDRTFDGSFLTPETMLFVNMRTR